MYNILTLSLQYGKIYIVDNYDTLENKAMTDDREYYIEGFHKARESGKYYLYGENPEEMTLEELQDAYMTMQNYLSDARTHDF